MYTEDQIGPSVWNVHFFVLFSTSNAIRLFSEDPIIKIPFSIVGVATNLLSELII